MQNIKENLEKNINLRQYSDLINKIAKVEYKAISTQHLIDFEELVNIGLQTVDLLFNQKDTQVYNESYLSTAIKWAIRNELRSRYRWYGVRQNAGITETQHNDLKDAIYSTILSTDELYDSEKTFEIRDDKKNPEEKCEFSMFATSVKEAVMNLPKRERELIESKFFKEQKLQEISDEYSISPSRISRIIKSGLSKIKDELIKSEII